jgi:hypothetical protein
MHNKLFRYIFSDHSVIIDDILGQKAAQHAFCNPNIECVKVEDINRK